MIVRLQPASRAFCERRLVRPAPSFLPTDSLRPQLGPFIFHRSANSARNRNLSHPFKIAGLQSLYLPGIRKRGGGVSLHLSASLYSVSTWQVQLLQQLAASFFLFALFYARVPFVFNSLQPLSQKQGGGQGPLSGWVRGHETRDVTGWRRRGASRPANAKPPKSSEA